MPRRIQKQQEKINDLHLYGQPSIPQGSKVAGYIRQSTKNQAESNHESAEMQAADVIRVASRLGVYDEACIIYFTENIGADGKLKNASGRLRIDQREGLAALVERIKTGEVKAVIVWREDRLFRDETLIQPLTFADICKQNNCLIATPHYTYDFNKNRYDLQLFVTKAIEAANFLKDYVKQQLQGGRERVSLRGEYDGRVVTWGYIYERKPSDTKIQLVRKPIIYPATAKIVKYLFERFYALNMDFPQLYRETSSLPHLFPLYPQDTQAKYITKTNARITETGYQLGKEGLFDLLTNVMYLGHWTFRGAIIKYNNHEAVVDERLFMYAYNALAFTDFDGNPNEKRDTHPTRYTQYGSRPTTTLLDGVLESNEGYVQVYHTTNRTSYCVYKALSSRTQKVVPLSLQAKPIDDIFVDRLFEVAHDPYFFDSIHAYFQEQLAKVGTVPDTKLDQITTCKNQIAAGEATLKLPPDVLDDKTRIDTALALKKAREVLAALEKAQIKDDPLTEEEVDEYLYAVSDLENVWHKLPIEKQRKLVSKLCHRITIDKISTHWLMFSIHWVGIYGGEDVAYVWRDSGAMKAWTDDEVTILRDSYLTAPAQELLEQLPERTWHSITCAASELKLGRREKHQEPKIVNATSEDLEIMRNLGIEDQLKGVQALWMSQTNLAGSSAPSLSTVPRLTGSSARHRRIGRS